MDNIYGDLLKVSVETIILLIKTTPKGKKSAFNKGKQLPVGGKKTVTGAKKGGKKASGQGGKDTTVSDGDKHLGSGESGIGVNVEETIVNEPATSVNTSRGSHLTKFPQKRVCFKLHL